MAGQCQRCNAELSAKELEAGQCDSCGTIVLPGGQPAPEAAKGSEPARRGSSLGSCFAVLLSLAALGIAVIALVLAVFHEFNSKAIRGELAGYDLSSPADAYKSRLKMTYDVDVLALAAMERRLRGPEAKERLDTLEIKREEKVEMWRSHKDKSRREIRFLFVTYKQNGVDRYQVVAMEKQPDSGLWREVSVNTADLESDDKAVAKAVEEWDKKNRNSDK
jgi:hypothetical protein